MVQQFAFVPFNFYFFAEMTAQFPHNQSLQFRVRFYCNFLTSISSFLRFYRNFFYMKMALFHSKYVLIIPIYLDFAYSSIFFTHIFKVCRFLFWTLTFVTVCSFPVFVSHFLSTSENKSSLKQNLVVLFLFFPFFKMVVFLYMLGVNSVYIANIKNWIIHFRFLHEKRAQIYKLFYESAVFVTFLMELRSKKVFLIN